RIRTPAREPRERRRRLVENRDVRGAPRAIRRGRRPVEPADGIPKLLEIRHRILLLIESAPRGIPYVKSNRHIYRRTLLHDPDAPRSWIAAALRAAGARGRRTRRRRRTGRGRRPDPVDRRTHGGDAEDRRVLSAVLGRAHGIAVRRNP